MRKIRKLLSVIVVAALIVGLVPTQRVSAATKLKAPVVSVKTVETFYPKLSWKTVKNATSYSIYRKVPGAEKYTKIASIKKTSYIDRNFNTGSTKSIKYYVVATKGSVKSAKSEVVKWNPVALNTVNKVKEGVFKAIGNEKAESITFSTTCAFSENEIKELIQEAGLEADYIASRFGYYIRRIGSTYLYRVEFERESFKRFRIVTTPEEAYNTGLELLSSMDFNDKYIYCTNTDLFEYVNLACLQHPEYGYGVIFYTYTNGLCSFSSEEAGADLIKERYNLACEVADEVIERIIEPEMTDKEKIKAVHDYLEATTVYDSFHSEEYDDPCFSAYGCLVENSCVCMGYVAATNIFARKLGIPSIAIVDYGNGSGERHSWNYLYVDGEYCYMDVTWDDPVPDLGIYYDSYLLVDEDVIAAYHNNWDRSLYSEKYLDLLLETGEQ